MGSNKLTAKATTVAGKGTLAAAAKAAAKATAALAGRKKGRDKVGSDDELENVRVKLLQHRTKKSKQKVNFRVFMLPFLFFTLFFCE